MHTHPSHSSSKRHHGANSQDNSQPSQGMVQHLQHVKAMQVILTSSPPICCASVLLLTPCVSHKACAVDEGPLWHTHRLCNKTLAMQDQATALSHSVQDLQQQLRSLQASDRIQQELQPILDDVKRTSQDLNRSIWLQTHFLIVSVIGSVIVCVCLPQESTFALVP